MDSPGFEDEKWRFVPEFEDYIVSDHGRIVNLETDRFVTGTVKHNGSIQVCLTNQYGSKLFYLHRLVAELYFDEFEEGMYVRHLDRDKSNNHVYNLLVIGPFNGNGPYYKPGYRGGRLVKVVETGQIFANTMSAALYFETDPSTIYKCLRGERLKHLGYTFEYVD